MKLPSNKQFGIVFFIFFLILSLYLFKGLKLYLYSIIFLSLSLIFLVLGLFNSKILYPLNLMWAKLGFYLGIIISPIIMGLIFFLIVTPIGIIMRYFSKNFLNLKFNNDKSYWIEKKEPKSKMKNQF